METTRVSVVKVTHLYIMHLGKLTFTLKVKKEDWTLKELLLTLQSKVTKVLGINFKFTSVTKCCCLVMGHFLYLH